MYVCVDCRYKIYNAIYVTSILGLHENQDNIYNNIDIENFRKL